MIATAAPPARRYRCECHTVFQFFGSGRHRRFYELDDLHWERPVVTRRCPSCQRRLQITRGPLDGAAGPQGDDFPRPPSTRTRLETQP
jgi:hypothetical protein